MKSLLLIIIVFVCTVMGCKKSEGLSLATPQTCNSCLLTANKWNLSKEIIKTDAGDYALSPDQLGNLFWKSYVFNQDQTCSDNQSNPGTYLFYDATSFSPATIVVIPCNGSLGCSYSLTSITKDSLVLQLSEVPVHPLIFTSQNDMGEYYNFLSPLHDDFGVDTSTIKWILPVLEYAAGVKN